MMIEIKRFTRERIRTLGNLYINGVFFCNTLEEADRHFPRVCNSSFFTQRRMRAVCTHVINRGESCAMQGTYQFGFYRYPGKKNKMLAILDEPHHKYNKIYMTGSKTLSNNIYPLIQIGFYNKETDEFNCDREFFYKKIQDRIKRAIRREEDIVLRINYNDV